jgi:hypothetical protein
MAQGNRSQRSGRGNNSHVREGDCWTLSESSTLKKSKDIDELI